MRTRHRSLVRRSGRDFSSNDYLGLAGSAELRDAARAALDRGVPIGSGGSRLLRGNHDEHEALEAEAAAFFGAEAALFFSSGYAANSALVSSLPQRDDLIVFDELVHASTREGLRLARATAIAAEHNDVGHFEKVVADRRRNSCHGQIWLFVESLYSMDGDVAPLADLMRIVETYDAILVVDEAHSTGVFGDNGRGLAQQVQSHEKVITVRTCGKALGCEGALVCGSGIVRDFLVNRGRGFIFSTAPSPLMAALVRASLNLLAQQPERIAQLWDLVGFAHRQFESLGLTPSGSQIQPVILGANYTTMQVAEALQAEGFDVRGIRPPTVPNGTSRLRISLTLNTSRSAIDALSDALEQHLKRVA